MNEAQPTGFSGMMGSPTIEIDEKRGKEIWWWIIIATIFFFLLILGFGLWEIAKTGLIGDYCKYFLC